MDQFERELARMMRDAQEQTPFEPAQQNSLREGVRVRRRIRAAQKAASCVLAAAGICVGVFLLPHAPDRDRPLGPVPRPTTTPASPYVTPSPTPSSSGTPSESATGTAENTAGTSGPPETPTTTESSTSAASDPGDGATSTTRAPATEPATPSETPTSSPPPSHLEPSSSAETNTG
ncbi:hypothetical protein OG410_38345 [Streptomyces sp. NBC_00659]|uniref:hypothetical protein n=1 Tax=Streptomyces sp. NBC_00659 TaxID=2903669 RepID=UPI002E330C87|nr:hypothetical protein [Streptomyces sp. NBC_00659]